MSTARLRAPATALLLTLPFLVPLFGCPELELLSLDDGITIPAEDDFWLVGANDERLVIARERYPSETIDLAFSLDDINDPNAWAEWDSAYSEFDVAVVNTQTLNVVRRFEDLSAGYNPQSDGDWLVWPVFDGTSDTATIAILDLTTGEQQQLPLDDIPAEMLYIEAVDTGRIFASAGRWGASSAILIIDIASADVSVLDVADLECLAVAGDRLAAVAYPPFDADTQPVADLFLGPNIELWDLATGQRRTIARDLDYVSELYLAHGQVVWTEVSDDLLIRTTVHAFDLATDTTSTLLTLEPQAYTDYAAVADASTAGLLLEYSTSSFDVAGLSFSAEVTEELVLRTFAGQETTIYAFNEAVDGLSILQGTDDTGSCYLYGKFVGDLIVHTDPADCGTFVAYDTPTGQTRRFQPFAD